ncbi:MAG: hypothetical protein LKJ51_06870 [Limosilactobacillus sp.]|uniref:hypothetical protein n=1 Tax=Limosilactobacillus sp. TaxID=2773925 RepID=UPI0025C29B97|nr:hypothetical protein [Limosilactobacillus sp.]MCI1975621.1 hypothetical protein [Limosilactobacillus sp.]MCI2031345.1 hypothetical protein [Limosilactobacillus sp.]
MNSEQKDQFEKAKRLTKENKWRDAAAIFLDLRDQVNDSELVVWTTRALYNSKQYKLAYQVAIQEPQAFTSDLEFLVQVSLKAQHFISTRAMLLRQNEKVTSALLPLVQQAEENYNHEFKETIQNRLRNFYHLGDYSLVEQRQRLLAADQLPLTDFMIGAKFLLRDPFTQQFVKADILNILQQIHCREEVTMLWIDKKEYSVIPAELPMVYQNPVVIHCQQILSNKLGQTNPQLLRSLQMQLDLQTILLNPLISKVITDAEEWIDLMIKRATTGEYSGKNENIIHWQKRLNQFIDNLQ